ncbi:MULTISPECIES: hypothetical protein [Rhizobium]|uniref:Uncharacterized protein n=1 Tax=Rhizobium tropici TaxID=398 RepID=A0A6P1CFH2_RHITR|nr:MULTISPECIES: hypothetical protein [Rhizobium]MBB4245383.1 hypothetical protein [Rhizobium tropici]MBB5596742.1 hypothetical protein [Rhizobium tropici]MBB6495734.1 hypothetical protein [Rhizobium tropici]NEV15106.1 hypothetical protein [Rhizobium tropici]
MAQQSLAHRRMETGGVFGKMVLGDFHERYRKYGNDVNGYELAALAL